MDRLLGLSALLGFVLSLVVHVLALYGVDVRSHVPFVFVLHLGIFAVFLPFVFAIRKTIGAKPRFEDIRVMFPPYVMAVGLVAFVYALVNFAAFMAATGGGSPSIKDGKYMLSNRGKVIREISPAEYTAFRANEVRGFSGHWLVFYLVPFGFFMLRRKDRPSGAKLGDVRRPAGKQSD